MAQVSVGNYPIPNSTGANVRADINENLTDLYSTSSGSTPPAAAGSATGQLWIDTSTTPDTLKVKTGSGTTASNYTTLGNIATNLGHAVSASPTFTGNIGFPAGSNSSLPIRNAADTDTGIYWGATNELDIRAGNTDAHTFTSSASEPKLPLRGTNGSASAPALSFSSDTNLGLYRSAADTLAVTTGGTERAYFNSNGLNIKGQLDLRLYDSNSSNYAAIQAPSNIGSNYTLTLPDNDGNANDILKSNGSGVLSFVALSTLISDISGAVVNVFSSSGTFTPASGRTGFLFILIGGGGSSGGGRANNDDGSRPARSGQGGSGATAIKFYNSSEMGANASVTVGAGGSASTSNGNAGGSSSVNPAGSGSTCTAGGGGGSNYAGADQNTGGGAGGTCSNQLLAWNGISGLNGNVSGYTSNNNAEFTGMSNGRGGAGKDHPDAANSAGNAGGAGYCVVFQW
ncbi:tail fiber protein [uncultured Mediterranean phage]|nr:tail fiber protein [uncultured Mediterranean phage]